MCTSNSWKKSKPTARCQERSTTGRCHIAQVKNMLAAIQRKMKRSTLNITYRNRKKTIWVREKTKVTHVIEQVRRRKWTWAGHISRIRDNQWTLHIAIWKPYERKRPRGRPVRCWRDELDDYWKSTIWQRIAQDRQMWKQHAWGLRPITGHYGCKMMIFLFSKSGKKLHWLDKSYSN